MRFLSPLSNTATRPTSEPSQQMSAQASVRKPTGIKMLREKLSFEAINFTDGKRSILEITRAVSAEYGPVEIQNVYDFFKILEKAG